MSILSEAQCICYLGHRVILSLTDPLGLCVEIGGEVGNQRSFEIFEELRPNLWALLLDKVVHGRDVGLVDST